MSALCASLRLPLSLLSVFRVKRSQEPSRILKERYDHLVFVALQIYYLYLHLVSYFRAFPSSDLRDHTADADLTELCACQPDDKCNKLGR